MSVTPGQNPVVEYLHTLKIEGLVQEQQVHTVKETDSIEAAIKLMTTHKIISCPVLDKSGNLFGIIDTLDIVCFVLSVVPDREALKAHDLASLEMSGRAMALAQVSDAIAFSKRPKFTAFAKQDPVSSIVESFANGAHRVVVQDGEKLVGVCSQLDVAKLVAEHIPRGNLKILGEKSIKEIGIGAGAPVTVKATETVLKALYSINHGISAVGITDTDGKLAGNFSATDIIGLYQEQFPDFLNTTQEFLEKHSPGSLTPICVYETATFQEVLNHCVTNKIHRVWVINNDYQPQGVVSLTDIFKVVKDFKL